MTLTSTAELVGSHERISYTVEHRGTCVLITGAVPASAFVTLMQLAPKRSVADPECARVLGATFAFGPKAELEALRKAGAEQAYRHARAAYPSISDGAVRWLAGGERGISSNAIFTRLTGIDAMEGWDSNRKDYPHDPSDFRRCQLLLEQVPEFQHWFKDMRDVSPVWARLVDAWPVILSAMDCETPDWRSPNCKGKAPAAYQLIQRAISS